MKLHREKVFSHSCYKSWREEEDGELRALHRLDHVHWEKKNGRNDLTSGERDEVWFAFCRNSFKTDWTDRDMSMDFISHPVYLSHPDPLDPSVNTLQHQAWCSEVGNDCQNLKSIKLYPSTCNENIVFVFLDVAPTASSHKVFLLIIGWIAACVAVVYVVLFMIWVHTRVYCVILHWF